MLLTEIMGIEGVRCVVSIEDSRLHVGLPSFTICPNSFILFRLRNSKADFYINEQTVSEISTKSQIKFYCYKFNLKIKI
jgi:hypothetical protein